jgi:hypothetical protein
MLVTPKGLKMATGDTLVSFEAQSRFPPSANAAGLDQVATTLIPCLDYDDGTSETSYWLCQMPGQYDGTTALTVVLAWKFTTFVGSQTCDWEVSFYRLADDVDSVEAFTFAAAQTVLATEATAAGKLDYASVNFTNAQADGVQPNEWFILRVVRDATGGTASPGDAELIGGEIKLQ